MRTLALSVMLLLSTACGQDAAPPAATPAPRTTASVAAPLAAEDLGTLGAAISRTPDRADELLRERGLTRASFEAQIRDVTENAATARRYTEAFRKANGMESTASSQ